MKPNIPSDIFSDDLISFILENDEQPADLLYKICFARLTDYHESDLIADMQLTKEEKDIVIENHWHESTNYEIKARCLDLLRRFQKDKRKITATSSDCYLEVFSKCDEIEYLIRAITVRNIKVLNDDMFLKKVKVYINENNYPYWLNKLIIALKKSYSVEQLLDLVPSIEEWLNKAIISKDFRKERFYLEALLNLGSISKNVYHKRIAISFENEADETANNRKENTFYPNLPDIYQDAYNEIFKINEVETEIYNRIREKLLREKRIFIEMLTIYGVKTKLEIHDTFIQQVKNSIGKLNIKSNADALSFLLSVPFPTSSDIAKYVEICRKTSPMTSLFGKSHLNNDGNIIGNADCDVALRTEAHIYFRQERLYVLWSFIEKINWSEIDVENKFGKIVLKETKPIFIENDKLYLWEKGITAGLNKDFITASHILMPQFEHALHNIAEIHHGKITSFEAKRQEEPTLGKILSMLHGVIEAETLFEIESFLQSGIDVNFRNHLLHGLMSPYEIERYGIYLWWICLKFHFSKDFYV